MAIEKHTYLVTRVAESTDTVTFAADRIGTGNHPEDDPPAATRVDAYSPIEAIAIVRQGKFPPDPMARLFTAQEVIATVMAVAAAERAPGREIMGRVRADLDVSPETAEAIRHVVIAAYVELLVGE